MLPHFPEYRNSDSVNLPTRTQHTQVGNRPLTLNLEPANPDETTYIDLRLAMATYKHIWGTKLANQAR